jgi:hypothetical protein
MQPILITKDLWELVIEGYVFSYDEEYKALDVDGRKRLKELISKDNEALSLIGNSIDVLIFPRINAAKSSKQAWDIVKNTYEGVIVAK